MKEETTIPKDLFYWLVWSLLGFFIGYQIGLIR